MNNHNMIPEVIQTNPPFISDLKSLHNLFGVPNLATPTIPDTKRIDLRHQLVNSEVGEFNDTLHLIRNLNPQTTKYETIEGHLGNLADDLCDILYVVFGTALEFGIHLEMLWPLVQHANLNKLWKKEVAEKLLKQTLAQTEHSSPEYTYLSGLLFAHNDDTLINHGWTYKETTIENKVAVFDGSGKFRKPPGWLEPDMKGMMSFIMLNHREPNHPFRFLQPNNWFYITLEDTLEPHPNGPGSIKSYTPIRTFDGKVKQHYFWHGPFNYFFDAQNHSLGNLNFKMDLKIDIGIPHMIPVIL